MSSTNIDLGTVFEFRSAESSDSFGVTLATLLQCLCAAEARGLVPPLEKEWEVAVIPKFIREMMADLPIVV